MTKVDRQTETATTLVFLRIYREILIKLYTIAQEGYKCSYVSCKTRKRFKTFASDKMLRCIQEASKDIEDLEEEQEVYGDPRR